ncbi:MAG: hypothetical protein K0V04_39540 [Deltaproteobacteria bacterium]|nr:hypothetical protein [Deltaproteobacteria bacterium]
MSGGPPQRLLDGGDLDPALRTDLSRAAGHDVGYDVAAGATRFEATLARGAPPPGDGGGTAAVATASSKASLIVVGLVGAAVVAGAIAWALTGEDEPAPPAVAVAAVETQDEPTSPGLETPEPSTVVEPSIAVEPSAPAESEGEPADLIIIDDEPSTAPPAQPIKPSRSPGTRGPSKRGPSPKPTVDDDRLRREMEATQRARRALTHNPARALSLVREANEQFPKGLFAEDREGIAILALFGLHRDEAAQRRAKAFLRAHPRGSYADKIRAVVDGTDKP